jgi:tetratricopeptide (TPR) repeat protein
VLRMDLHQNRIVAICLILCVGFVLPVTAFAGNGAAQESGTWRAFIDKGRYDEAQVLCDELVVSKVAVDKAEGHKCLANLALVDASTIFVEKSEGSGGQIRSGFHGEGVNASLSHLEQALDLSPNDLTIHQGRLHILMQSGRYDDLAPALADSLMRYTREDALDAWLAYSRGFWEWGFYNPGVEYLRVLERRYPRDHRIKANLGAFLGYLGKDNESLDLSEQAVALAPDDPLNNWNLARQYDYMGRIEEAEEQYTKALALYEGKKPTMPIFCYYAEFVQEKLQDKDRACAIRKERCPEMHEKYCAK